MRKEVCRFTVWMLAGLTVVALSGCRAPRPSFNFWAPFGPSRVAPPKTGSYGTPQNYYPKDPTASPESPALPNAAPMIPVSPVQPSSDFPIDSSTNPAGMGATNEVKNVRVGKWRPPKHDPQVRSVSFETNVSPTTVSPTTVPAVTIPSTTIPSTTIPVSGEPRQLTENQTRVAIPMTPVVSLGNREPATTPHDTGVVKARFEEPSAVAPAASTGGWSQRKKIQP